jgi:threonylcarbamoyladenosine tRNA methylthiotransferase CDKAL1
MELDDLEDLPHSLSLGGNERSTKAVVSRNISNDFSSYSGNPYSASIWVKTFGCSHNVSDGEYMAGQLSSYGYRFDASSNTRSRADIVT